MKAKEAIAELYKLNGQEEICLFWQTKPDNINVYEWGWICDNFNLEMLRKFNNVFCDAINSLKKAYPYNVRIASGDVVFVEKE